MSKTTTSLVRLGTLAPPTLAQAQTPSTVLIYRGALEASRSDASGVFDLRVALADAAVGQARVGTTVCEVMGRAMTPVEHGRGFVQRLAQPR